MHFRHWKRREFITLLGGAPAWPLAALAQPARLPTIGFFSAGSAAPLISWVAAMVQRLRELGWIEGRTVAIEYRWAEGHNERLAEIAAEFVRLKVDVIVTHSAAPVIAAKQTTAVIPIVFAGGSTRYRSGREPAATGEQRHRSIQLDRRSCRQTARPFARAYPPSSSVSNYGQYRRSRRHAGSG
jgi:hypothetical protein